MRGSGDVKCNPVCKCLVHGGGSIKTISPHDVDFMKMYPAGSGKFRSLGGVSAAGPPENYSH